MKRLLVGILALLPALGVAQIEEDPKSEEDAQPLGKSKEESFEGKVVVLSVGQKDLMNKQSFKFWRRMMRRAEEEKAEAVVFELDTPGGLAFDTKEIMTEMSRLKIDSYAFVKKEALSAGALISVATNGIYMKEDTLIGAAGLVSSVGEIDEVMRAKLESVFDAHVRTVVERKGHNLEVVRAMMFRDEEADRKFGEVEVRKGGLLTLTAQQAVSEVDGKPLLAKAIVGSIEELLEMEGLGDAVLVRAEPTPFERFAWWVAYLSPLLILVGVGAAYAEMKAPGFGVAGAISLTAFGIFFFGNYVAGNLAGYEMAALFVLGVVLIIVEIFLIPGTGIAGILGAVCIVSSLLFGMVDRIEWNDYRVGDFGGTLLEIFSWPALALGIGLTGGALLVLLLMRFLPDIPIFRFLMVEKELAGGASIAESTAVVEERVGWTGETLTDLRPAGKAEFDGRHVDVVADGEFIPKGAQVRIVQEDGMRVVVTQIEAL